MSDETKDGFGLDKEQRLLAKRLVTGVIIEISEEWETGKIYLQPETKKQQPN